MGLHGDDGLGYEQLRNARLAENRQRMEALGLVNLSHSLSNSARSKKSNNAINMDRKWLRSPNLAVPPVAARRSSRLLGITKPSYKEESTVKDGGTRIAVEDSRNRLPEVYTEEDEKLLGHSNEDWELFKDGYGADGSRIYDTVNGKTCHQCRQKTLGLRTSCSRCESLRGQFCGDCLFMRYGENVLETKKNQNWVCPWCRGICNCSFCRIKKGWAPTGSMYRLALSLNFKSVAHYLITTRRGSEENLTVQEGSAATDLKNEVVLKVEEGSSAEDNKNEQPEGFSRRSLVFETPSELNPQKKQIVLDISDTERGDSQQRSDGNDTIEGRRRKRPRRCKTNSHA